MEDKARADVVEQELIKRKGMLGQRERDELRRYVSDLGATALADVITRAEQIADPIVKAKVIEFVQHQIQIWSVHSTRMESATMEQLEEIATRSVHVNPEDKPTNGKKGFW